MTGLIVALVLVIPLTAKTPPQQKSVSDFATPADAVQALLQAAENNDTAALLTLFGPGGDDIVKSGDPRQDKDRRMEFARLGHEALRVQIDAANTDKATFSIGQQAWPFPVPLVRNNGKWSFDSAQGRIEILAHRIGENESDVIDICHGYVDAQLEYASEHRDGIGSLVYAQKAASSAGKHDGLYWGGTSGSLVSESFTEATGRKAAPYHGYYFRILKAQGSDAPGGAFDYVVDGKMIGGFAMVAWPAEYGISGVQTFIVSHAGIVYQKDLGPRTATLANSMIRFNPDESWRKVAD